LRAHYFENTPTLGHYSTLWGFISIAKEFQIKIGTTYLSQFIKPLIPRMVQKSVVRDCCFKV
jgi:ssDNA-specific exonuclease RecJ